ncbi:hypothetical protein HK102_009237 [Quaeritorhiza haematococci]|nr:hypothetical protein HK102_009237 [Quaeritorhiza haematococci]
MMSHDSVLVQNQVSFFLEQENALFSGDMVLGEGTTVFEDLSAYMNSLDRISKMNVGRIYPGHGPVVEDGHAKIVEYMGHRREREKQIVEVLESMDNVESTSMDLVKTIYKGYPESLFPAAERSVVLHLQKLHQDGVVDKTEVDGHTRWILRSRVHA